MKSYQKEQDSYAELHYDPPKPTIRSANGKVDYATGRVNQHNPDSRAEQCKDLTGWLPFRSQEQANHIFPDQGKTGPNSHTYKRQDGQSIQEVSLILRRPALQPAQRGEDHVRDGRRELVRWKQEQIVRLLIEPERG